MVRQHVLLAAVVLSLAAVSSGCGESSASTSLDPKFVVHRERLLLAEEPSGAVGVLDLMESKSFDRDVVIVGRIGGVSDPFSQSQAGFALADPSTAAHDDCADSGCQFCASKKAAGGGVLLVRFVDEHNNILPVDARDLFGVSEKQTVVVRGRVEKNEQNVLIVTGDGLYVRQ